MSGFRRVATAPLGPGIVKNALPSGYLSPFCPALALDGGLRPCTNSEVSPLHNDTVSSTLLFVYPGDLKKGLSFASKGVC